MVEVLTLPNGLSAEEVERIVTVPLEFGLSGTLGLQAVRSISLFGLSDGFLCDLYRVHALPAAVSQGPATVSEVQPGAPVLKNDTDLVPLARP
jgi:hypothetical protein